MIPAYALALQNLGLYLLKDVQDKCALDFQLLATAIQRTMVSTHGCEYKVHLARALSSLVQSGTVTGIPSDELVDTTDESIENFRELAGKNPLSYARELVDMLQANDCILGSLEPSEGAIATGGQAISLTEHIILGIKMTYQEESGIHCMVASCDSPEPLPPTWKESFGMYNFMNTDTNMYPMTPSGKSSNFVHDDSARDPTTTLREEMTSTGVSFPKPTTFSTGEGNFNFVAEKLAQLSITSFITSDAKATTDYGSLFLSREL